MYNSAIANGNAYKADITGQPSLGSWYWLRCAVSPNIMKYYLSEFPLVTLVADKVYDAQRNEVPFRYFYSPNEKSSLKIENAKDYPKKLYLRSVSLFNDYIPKTYQFKNM